MDVLDAIKLRRSIRKFKDRPVEWEKVSLILEAAKSAPTAGNLQNFKFILVTDKDKIKKLSEACLKQFWIQTANMIIVVVAEPQKAEQFYGARGERLYTVQNCAAAVQNILLTATSLGLGSCWVGAFDESEIKDILSIPKESRPQAVVPIGYADEVVPEPMHYPLETQIFLESYGNRMKDVNAVLGYYSTITERNIKKAKESVKSTAQMLKEKIKEKFSKQIGSIKEKKQEEEYKEEPE